MKSTGCKAIRYGGTQESKTRYYKHGKNVYTLEWVRSAIGAMWLEKLAEGKSQFLRHVGGFILVLLSRLQRRMASSSSGFRIYEGCAMEENE